MLALLTRFALAAAPIGSAWVDLDSPEARAALSAWPVGFAESTDGRRVLIHGDAATFARMQEAGFVLSDVRTDHRQPLPMAVGESGYHDAQGVEDALAALAAANPGRCALSQIGVSLDGRAIWALDLGPADAPQWTLVGGLHGDERVSTELALRVAEGLLNDTPPLDGLVHTRRVRVIPALNPDGLDEGSRYNAADVDLNRNFGFHWSAYAFGAGLAPFSEPESVALRTAGEWSPAAASLMLHAGETNIGYVWNWTSEPTLEADWLAELGRVYADATSDAAFWVTQGADWYVTTGDATDWSFGRVGTFDFTVELSREKTPSLDALPAILDAHMAAVAAMLRLAIPLVGRVTDAATGRPIPATLTLDGGSAWLNHPVSGAFARLTPGGLTRLTASAPGYRPLTLDIDLGETDGNSFDIALEPTSLAALRPEPTLLPYAAGLIEVTLPESGALDPVVVLRRHGFADVIAQTDGEAALIDPALLYPGAWTLDLGDRVLPRALLVGADRGDVRVGAVTLGGDSITIHGENFAAGTALYALVGEERAWIALPLLSADDASLVADSQALPDTGTVDLVVVSQGLQIPIVDLLGEPVIDEGPSLDSGDSTDPGVRPSACACHSARRGPQSVALAALLLYGSLRCRARA